MCTSHVHNNTHLQMNFRENSYTCNQMKKGTFVPLTIPISNFQDISNICPVHFRGKNSKDWSSKMSSTCTLKKTTVKDILLLQVRNYISIYEYSYSNYYSLC